MDEMKLTNRQKVKVLLDEYCLTQKWLLHEINKVMVEPVPKSTLSSALSGQRGGERSEEVLTACVAVLEQYKQRMGA